MRNTGVLCDVKVSGHDYLATKVLFKGHSALFAANSKVLYTLLAAKPKVPPNAMFQISTLDTLSLQMIVDYMYGVIPIDLRTNVARQELLKNAAEKLEVKSALEYLKSLSQVKDPVSTNMSTIKHLQEMLTSEHATNMELSTASPRATHFTIPVVKQERESVEPMDDTSDMFHDFQLQSPLQKSTPKRLQSNLSKDSTPKKLKPGAKRCLSCLRCPRTFLVLADLIRHMQRSHSIQLHKNTVILNCKHCCKLFWHKDALLDHQKSCTKKSKEVGDSQIFSVFNCKHCNNIYIGASALQAHIEKCHTKPASPKSPSTKPIEDEKELGMKSEEDVEMSATSKSPSKLRDMPSDEKEDEADIESPSENEQPLTENSIENKQEDVENSPDNDDVNDIDEEVSIDRYAIDRRSCSKCSMIFDTRYKLQSHLWNSHKITRYGNFEPDADGNFNCTFCSLSFPSSQKVYNHLDHFHIRAQNCALCVQRFDTAFSLLVHMHHEHPGHEYYMCCICGRKSSTVVQVLRHFTDLHGVSEPYSHLRGLKFVINPMNLPKVKPLHNAIIHSSATNIVEWGGTWLEEHFTCPHCNVAHKTAKELTADLVWHLDHEKSALLQLDGRSHECQLCGMLYNEQSGLTKHWETSHTEYMKCKHCDVNLFDYGMFTKHVRQHEMDIFESNNSNLQTTELRGRRRRPVPCGPYGCLHCGKEFNTDAFKYLMHAIKHHGDKSAMCILCGRVVSSLAYMVGHLSTHNITVTVPQIRALKLAILPTNLRTITPLHTAHVNSTEDVVTDWASKWLISTYLCTYCNMSFPSQLELSSHIRSHLEQESEMLSVIDTRVYECDICNETFDRHRLLTRHRLAKHDKGYSCTICGKKFHASTNLQIHRRQHSVNRPHCCRHCGKTFKQSGHLSDHLRTHSDERNYSCEYCGNSFKMKGSLRQHVRRLHDPNYVKKFECDYCGDQFHTITALGVHSTTHSEERPHECIECGRTYKNIRTLRKHMHVHGVEMFRATAPPIGRRPRMIQMTDEEIAAYDSYEDGKTCETIVLEQD